MLVRVVVPPEPIVTWEEAKKHLRLDTDEEQDYVEALVAAATGWIDGPGGWLGRCIGAQTLELVDCAFGNGRLPYPPAVSITSVTYLGADGADHIMPSDQYRLLLNGSVSPLADQSWPSVGSSSEAVRIVFVAGYPDTDADPPVSTVPAAIKQAILLILGHWYRNRSEVITGTIVAQVPMAAEALLSTYRVWSA